LICHANAADGKRPHLVDGENLEDASSLRVNVRRYLSLKV
jgi:hypothetical protein